MVFVVVVDDSGGDGDVDVSRQFFYVVQAGLELTIQSPVSTGAGIGRVPAARSVS